MKKQKFKNSVVLVLVTLISSFAHAQSMSDSSAEGVPVFQSLEQFEADSGRELDSEEIADAQIVPTNGIVEKVKESKLRVLGATIRNDGRDEGILTACANEECTAFRFVYINRLHEAYYFGDTYSIAEHISKRVAEHATPEKQRRKAFKSVMSDYHSWKVKKHGLSNPFRGLILVGSALLMCTVLKPVVVAVSGSALPLIGVLSLVVIIPGVLSNLDQVLSIGDGKIAEVLQNQNGWNWAEHSKGVQEKTFSRVLEYFDSKNSLQSVRTL